MYSRRLTQKIEVEDDNENRGILKYFSIFMGSLGLLALLSILLIQFFLTFDPSTPTIFTKNNPIVILITGLIFTGVQFLLYKIINILKIPTKKLHQYLLGFTLFIGILVTVIFASPPYSDVWSVINGFSIDNWITVPYTNYYPNNMGLALLYQFIFKVLGRQAWTIMYGVNIASVIGMFYVIPKLTLKLGDEKSERICIQFLFFALPFSFMTTYLYNDLISLFLALQSTYFLIEFMKSEKIKNGKIILSGILLGLAYILKTNSIIFAIGIFIYIVLYIIKNRKITYKSFLSFLPIIILVFMKIFFQLSIPSLVTDYRKEEAQPAISWIAMAIADEHSIKGYKFKKPGMFNDFESWTFAEYKKDNKNSTKHDFIKDKDSRKNIYSNFIKARILDMRKHPKESLKFYAQKEVASWGDASFGSEKLLKESYENQKDIYNSLPFENIAKIQGIQSTSAKQYINNREKFQSSTAIKSIDNKFFLKSIERPFMILIFMGAMFYIVKKFKNFSLEDLLLLTIFIGGFMFHEFIWETQPRYLLAYFTLLIPFSAIGINQLLSIKKRTS